MKYQPMRFVLIIVASVSPVLLLFMEYKAGTTYAIHPFKRNLVEDALNEMSVSDLQHDSFYISGKAGEVIYLGNSTVPSGLFTHDGVGLKQRMLTGLSNPTHENRMRVDSPYVYIGDLVSYEIFQADLGSLNAKIIPFDRDFFSEAIPLNSNSIIRRTFSQTNPSYIFTKENILPEAVIRADDLLQKQVDGLFCTDGMLHYDRNVNRLTYVYYYRNQFFSMDTSLNLAFRGHTIDTISQARVKVARIESENSVTLAGPPAIVNRRSCVFHNWLFVNSLIVGQNETIREFEEVSAIDIYDLSHNGEYLMSFYVPDYKGHDMKMFVIFPGQLVAIYGRYLVSYSMNSDYFN